MSDLGVELGWYKNNNESNDNGVLINVHHLTKRFVKVKIYKYFNNNIDLNNIDERNIIHEQYLNKKIKVFDGALIYPYETRWIREYNLSIENKISE